MLKTINEIDDSVFDWNLLNGVSIFPRQSHVHRSNGCSRRQRLGGVSCTCNMPLSLPVTSNIAFHQGQAQLSQVQNIVVPQPQDRRRDQERQRDTEWRRISQGGGPIVVPPSPVLVRHGSKRKPNAGTPAGTLGQVTPLSAAAQVNVPVSTPQNRMSHISASHPYANAAPGTDYPRESNGDPYTAQPYARTSPMISTVVPPAISNFRAQGNEVGASHGEEYREQDGQGAQPKSNFWQVLTCRCC